MTIKINELRDNAGARKSRVRVGRGGPEITFETLNGSVRAIRAGR